MEFLDLLLLFIAFILFMLRHKIERTIKKSDTLSITGTHSDILSFSKAHKQYALSVPTIKHYEHINLDARKPIVPGSTNKLIFSKFFDAIIEKSQSPYKKSLANRRRRI